MKGTAINLVSVIGGEVLLRGANFMAVVVIARLYGASILGIYATVLAYVTLAVMVADNGLQVSSITEVARRPKEIGATFGQLYVVKTCLFFGMVVVLVSSALWFRLSALGWVIGIFLTLRTILYSYCQLHAGVLKALNHMRAIGTVQGIHCAMLLTGTALTYVNHWPVYRLLLWLLVCQTSELVLSGGVLFRYHARPCWTSAAACWRVLHSSTPIGITYSLAALILRADVIVLSAITSSKEVGYFAAANIPLTMVYVVAWLLGGVILPRMINLASDMSAVQSYVNRWLRLIFFGLAPCCLAAVWIIPGVTRFIYGSEYNPTGRVAAITVLAVPFILGNAVYLSRAIALQARSVYLGSYIGIAAFALLLDYFAAHFYGNVGVAIAIVVREIAMFMTFGLIHLRTDSHPSRQREAELSSSISVGANPSVSNSLS